VNREIQSGSIRAGLAARYDFAEHFYQHHFTVTVWIGATPPLDCLILVWLCLPGQPFHQIIVFNPSIFWRGFPHDPSIARPGAIQNSANPITQFACPNPAVGGMSIWFFCFS
jgi:hypothetical protein